MRKFVFAFITSLFILAASTETLFALNDPALVPNNKVGIHIIDENDLNDASNLVNSNGGDWGYVTIVIKESERDKERWQKVFDQMRKLHLIPIVRLASRPNGDIWEAPQEAEINNWVAFLNSLNWVVQNRYIIINNEPNHSKEWGGRLDPAGYAKYLKQFSAKLKSESGDYFILPAGLDPAAPNKNPTTMSSNRFILQMKQAEPDVFNHIDGWTSHPYPNGSVTAYKNELSLIGKKLPVFITETGWSLEKYSENEATDNLMNAYKNIWNDPQVVAVTPFILNYTAKPFDVFSWKKPDGSFYSYYTKVQEMPKVKGEPVQIESGQIVGAFAQPVIFTGIDFVGAILAKNTGQTIWTNSNISLGSENQDFMVKSYSLNNIEPMKLGLIFFKAAAEQNEGIYTNSLFLKNNKDKKITNSFSIEGILVKVNKEQIFQLMTGLIKNFQ